MKKKMSNCLLGTLVTVVSLFAMMHFLIEIPLFKATVITGTGAIAYFFSYRNAEKNILRRHNEKKIIYYIIRVILISILGTIFIAVANTAPHGKSVYIYFIDTLVVASIISVSGYCAAKFNK